MRIDFTNCQFSNIKYSGSEKKIGVIFANSPWMLKFRKPSIYGEMTNDISEYIGSKIFSLLGFEAQEVLLGIYQNEKVVACKDFMYGKSFTPFNDVGESSVDDDKTKYLYSYNDIQTLIAKNKKIGDKNSMQMSEEFARMAARQEMIRRMMQEYGQELKQGDAGNAKLSREIDKLLKQMEQTETDLVNRVISQQTINRQQQILTRMLEHEKAEMQREKEERRESREGKDVFHQPSPSDIERYKRMQKESTDMFRSVPPTLSPYYRSKVQDYFFSF